MKKHYFGKLLSAFIAAFTLAFITNAPVVAASDTPDHRMQVSPTFADVPELDPGESYTGSFKVQNTGQKAFDFSINLSPYSIADQDYTIDSVTESNYTQIKNWITVSEESGTLQAGESRDIEYTIKVPSNAPAGGQYALINVQMDQESDKSGDTAITATKQIGFRLLADIKGETKRSGTVVEQNIPSILFNPPISANSLVENTGNVHITASYVLQVFPLFSDEEVYTNEESPYEFTILPETTRYNQISWDGAPHLGIFRVKQTVKIADEVKTLEKTVFLCPIWFIFIILLLIFCVVFWIVSRIRNRKDR